jgi:hypothetical protein
MGSFENESDINEYFFSGPLSLIYREKGKRFGRVKAQLEIPYLQYQSVNTYVCSETGLFYKKTNKIPAMILLEAL